MPFAGFPVLREQPPPFLLGQEVYVQLAVQVTHLVLDDPRLQVLEVELHRGSGLVLGADDDPLGPGDLSLDARERQAALPGYLHLLGAGGDLRVEQHALLTLELDKDCSHGGADLVCSQSVSSHGEERRAEGGGRGLGLRAPGVHRAGWSAQKRVGVG